MTFSLSCTAFAEWTAETDDIIQDLPTSLRSLTLNVGGMRNGRPYVPHADGRNRSSAPSVLSMFGGSKSWCFLYQTAPCGVSVCRRGWCRSLWTYVTESGSLLCVPNLDPSIATTLVMPSSLKYLTVYAVQANLVANAIHFSGGMQLRHVGPGNSLW